MPSVVAARVLFHSASHSVRMMSARSTSATVWPTSLLGYLIIDWNLLVAKTLRWVNRTHKPLRQTFDIRQ